ncbi:MAG: VWA domain-containing protein [Acidobacteria bacterium]|nr:VWA domain-containing protein [Acidobacteriota bacterium]
MHSGPLSPASRWHIPGRCLLFFTLGLCIAAAAAAQPQPGQKAESPAPVDQSLHVRLKPLQFNVDVVVVPVTVHDSMNRPVMGLTQNDFSVFEDSAEQKIRYFSDEDAPISLGVLLDVSNSMKDKIDTAREAVVEFFKNSNPQDDCFVISFSDDPEVVADSTRSLAYMQARLAEARPAGHTALLDAIYLGLHKMRSARYQRRALLVISDGGDNHSRYSAREIRHMVEESDVQIYAVGLFSAIFKTPEEWGGQRLLSSITGATGGRTLTIHNPAELPEAAGAISRELRSQYVLGYSTSRAGDGKWRKIKVTAHPHNAPDHIQVHNKPGYRAGVALQPNP